MIVRKLREFKSEKMKKPGQMSGRVSLIGVDDYSNIMKTAD